MNPFEVSDKEIRQMIGDVSDKEIRNIKMLLTMLQKRTVGVANNGMTHGEGCWSWGPAHYLCAYEKVRQLVNDSVPNT